MIKRIIFDQDNTLIPWRDEEYWENVYKILKEKYSLNSEQSKTVKNVASNYELLQEKFDEKIMQNMINEALGIEYSIEFIQTIMKTFEKCIPNEKNQDLIDTLEYLSKKYDLVILTNWFTNQQIKRLENYNLLKYFNEVYGADQFKVKPNPEAYIHAIGPYKIEECVMIGDGIENDVYGALKVGMKAIFYNPNNTQVPNGDFINIKKFSELKEIF